MAAVEISTAVAMAFVAKMRERGWVIELDDERELIEIKAALAAAVSVLQAEAAR